MLSRSKLAGAALLLVSVAGLAQAETPAPVPESVRGILTAMLLDKVKDIRYEDASGKPISAERFGELQKSGLPFNVKKTSKPGQEMVAVLSITSKEALKAMAPPPPKIKPGEHLPPFRLTRLDGTTLDNAALRGRYSLVNFYFAECAPCIKEVPELNALAKSRADMNFVAVTFDTAAETRKFAADTKFAWALLPDSKKFIDQLGVKGYPSFALFDPNGALVAIGDNQAIAGGKKQTIADWVALLAPAAPK